MYVVLGNSLSSAIKELFNLHAKTHDTLEIIDASLGNFASSEAFSELIPGEHDIKGKPFVVVQSLGSAHGQTANDYVMQLVMTVDTLKKNGAGPVWIVAPFLAYARQDRPFDSRMTSVGLDTLAAMLKGVGAEGITTIDLHSQGGLTILKDRFGEGRVYNLDTTNLFAAAIAGEDDAVHMAVGGPDKGAHERAQRLAEKLGAGRFSIEKEHVSVNDTKVTKFVGHVEGETAITIDDMIDTGGTIANAQQTLTDNGATFRIVAAAHGILSGNALEKLFTRKVNGNERAIDRLLITDSIDCEDKVSDLRRRHGQKEVDDFVRILTVGPMLTDHTARLITAHPAMRAA